MLFAARCPTVSLGQERNFDYDAYSRLLSPDYVPPAYIHVLEHSGHQTEK